MEKNFSPPRFFVFLRPSAVPAVVFSENMSMSSCDVILPGWPDALVIRAKALAMVRIPMMSISRSEVMAISAERSDARLF